MASRPTRARKGHHGQEEGPIEGEAGVQAQVAAEAAAQGRGRTGEGGGQARPRPGSRRSALDHRRRDPSAARRGREGRGGQGGQGRPPTAAAKDSTAKRGGVRGEACRRKKPATREEAGLDQDSHRQARRPRGAASATRKPATVGERLPGSRPSSRYGPASRARLADLRDGQPQGLAEGDAGHPSPDRPEAAPQLLHVGLARIEVEPDRLARASRAGAGRGGSATHGWRWRPRRRRSSGPGGPASR